MELATWQWHKAYGFAYFAQDFYFIGITALRMKIRIL